MDTELIQAPQWLIDRMEALEKLPPPSPEQMRAQFAASAKFRRDNAKCKRHADYDMVNPPESDCYGCWCAYTDKHGTKEAMGLFHSAMDKYGGLKD